MRHGPIVRDDRLRTSAGTSVFRPNYPLSLLSSSHGLYGDQASAGAIPAYAVGSDTPIVAELAIHDVHSKLRHGMRLAPRLVGWVVACSCCWSASSCAARHAPPSQRSTTPRDGADDAWAVAAQRAGKQVDHGQRACSVVLPIPAHLFSGASQLNVGALRVLGG